ncbi:amino acid ABC transporter membrane protein 1, PAAT family [Agrococcus baldri]|uniref:Amino acid ABC transporter membrane protein 1, PAAT family n=1 Tax=Agrococcus baldri TaxID=153730 RepID=A0AA94HQ07_9MICO|nr:ectoine/hydroxyectoine ABC transporter permease subunit EhuC [Agrococcus baldri]SFS18882.1 amino acid ABC transporter membrane protein 1, PAAT family [Agrococcus baldri]
MNDDLSALWAAIPQVLEGMGITVTLTVLGSALAFVVAVVFGLMARSRTLVVRGFARVVIEFFRGTSLVVQLYLFFFVLPQLGWEMSPITAGVLAFGLNYGAYGAEVVRGSIAAVPAGQWEASTALSLSPVHRMRRIIIPQAWALMIPSLNNLLIQLLKGTAIVGFITLFDLTVALDKLRIATDLFFAYGFGLVLYFVLAYILTLGMNALEVRAKHRLGQGESLREALSFRTPDARGSVA